MRFQNQQGVTAMYYNVALVAPKNINSVNPVTTVAFFRANGTNRATNFATLGDTTFQNHVRKINTDDYTVLWRKQGILAPNSAVSTADNMGGRPAMKFWKFYTKLNRQIQYDDPESPAATNGKCCLVYWFGRVGDTSLASIAEVEVDIKAVMYYKEPKT